MTCAQSRRSFLKCALAGAAGTILGKVQTADTGAKHSPGISDVTQLSLSEASELIHSRKISPVELMQGCLSRIDTLNDKLNAFITVTADAALAQARAAEGEIQRGKWKGPLHGIPIALKDIIDTAGVRTTAGSGVFKDRVPTQDAEVVRRLKAAGAVFLGKLNMHEFAYGGSSAISYFGPVHNPWDPAYSPGGSSGGSAAAVAARLCYAAIGTDTGGSVRQPASYCGIVGLKPTYGRVSTSGVAPLSWSLDHVGPLTRTVKDALLVLQVIAGYDPHDIASMDAPVPDYLSAIKGPTSSLRLGIPRAYFYDDLHPEIQAAMEAAFAVLKKLTATQRDIAPLASNATYSSWNDPYVAVLTAEAYAYHQESISRTPELYQPPTLKRLSVGAEVTAAKYINSRRELDYVRRSIARVFDDVDLLITPTVRIPPFTIADLQGDLDAARAKELAMLHNTRPLNFPGLPTISVPCGSTRSGLPIGLQISARLGDEERACRLAHAYEQSTDWHKREPNLS
jgi:aspartyl-tRNA(Asn)/glutamyl-tRNA(Gln) amidotransferase subunit A